MRLVVMAALLAVAGARQSCSCRLTNRHFQVEGCGHKEYVLTTACEGHCYNTVPVFDLPTDWAEEEVCNGNWIDEQILIPGCPEKVTYPVATHCKCTRCNEENTHCGRFSGNAPSCRAD